MPRVSISRESSANCCPPMEWRPPATEMTLPFFRAVWMRLRHSSMEPGTAISRTRAELSCEWMSFTCRPVDKLPGGATSVNCGGFLTKHPEKHSAAPDMNPVLKNLRREILKGDRWLMLVPPAYTLSAKVSGGKQRLKRHTAARASCR